MEDVVNYTKSCTRCAERMPENRKARENLWGIHVKQRNHFKKIIEMNIIGPLPMLDNNIHMYNIS